jgi:hypothetical protein
MAFEFQLQPAEQHRPYRRVHNSTHVLFFCGAFQGTQQQIYAPMSGIFKAGTCDC